MATGRFITLEGSEGAGKSTNLDAIVAVLTERGIDHHVTREPGGTPMAEAIREQMLQTWEEPVDPLTELLLVFAARNQHLRNEILPRLQRGQWVICDRFTDATYAYQGSARGLPAAQIATLESWVQGELRPDLTLYLDLDPVIGRARIADREQDRLEQEQLTFFHRVRAGYLERARTEAYFRTIDAAREMEQVRAAVVGEVERFVSSVTPV